MYYIYSTVKLYPVAVYWCHYVSGATARATCRRVHSFGRRLCGIRVRDDPGVVVQARGVAQRRDVQTHGVRGRNLVLGRHLRPTGHKLVRVDVVLIFLVVAVINRRKKQVKTAFSERLKTQTNRSSIE